MSPSSRYLAAGVAYISVQLIDLLARLSWVLLLMEQVLFRILFFFLDIILVVTVTWLTSFKKNLDMSFCFQSHRLSKLGGCLYTHIMWGLTYIWARFPQTHKTSLCFPDLQCLCFSHRCIAKFTTCTYVCVCVLCFIDSQHCFDDEK